MRTFYSTCRHRDRRVGEVLAAEVYDASDARDTISEPPRSAESEALENLASSTVMRALEDLPECFRTAIYLADIDGYRYHEIAEMMGTPLGTVMSRIHRGRAMLRQKLRGFAPRGGYLANPPRLAIPAGRGRDGTAGRRPRGASPSSEAAESFLDVAAGFAGETAPSSAPVTGVADNPGGRAGHPVLGTAPDLRCVLFCADLLC